MKHRTEEVYDNEIAPLMAKIIEIAKRENIPMLVSFGMKMEDGTAGCCTTALSPDTEDMDAGLRGFRNRVGLALGVLRGHAGFDTAAALMITRYHPQEDQEDSLEQ